MRAFLLCVFFACLVSQFFSLMPFFRMFRRVPPNSTEPGVQGSSIIIGRAAGPSHLFAANLSGHDEFGLPYNIDVVLECKNHSFLSSESGTSRVFENPSFASPLPS